MSVVEDSYAGTQVSEMIDALIATATFPRVLLHTRTGPPQAAAPHQITFGHSIANDEILGRADYGRTFEPRFSRKIDSRHGQIIARIRMKPQKITVEAVTNQMGVELPLPFYSVVEAFSLDGRIIITRDLSSSGVGLPSGCRV